MAVSIDMDTGSPDQNLANAIILQAVTDYRSARKLLREHPKTPELVATAKIKRKERKKETGYNRSPEEKLLAKIWNAQKEVIECETFFKSRWFETLSNIDGKDLLKKLREEADDEDRACEDMASAPEAAGDGILGVDFAFSRL